MTAEPFIIDIPEATLADLHDRLARTRWPDAIRGAGWDYGVDIGYLRDLIAFWRDRFDWRAQERHLNRFSHYRSEIRGLQLHFILEKGSGDHPHPLILLHGWPASFTQMLKIIPLLAHPEEYGGRAGDGFDVIVPSLPGYGFSGRSREPGMTVGKMADLFADLMTGELGYGTFGIRGSDIGAGVGTQLALRYPERVSGLHLSGSNPPWFSVPADLTPSEQKFIDAVQQWRMKESAYAMVHGTKPQTLAYALNDSPAGLAAWITEKYRSWSDCDGDVETRFSKDELLTNLTIYWVTETINSSCRVYYESMHGSWPDAGKKVMVPTGFAQFPRDIFNGPREWSEREYRVTRWTEMPAGGHFCEAEEPVLLAKELREFFRPLRR
jgi:pimeloyl-ACP methyl ester carboxylesterase